MNTDITELKNFLSSPLYNELVEQLKQAAQLTIYPEFDDFEANYNLKMLTLANLSLAEIQDFMKNNQREIISYSITKHKLLNSVEQEEYLVGEDPDPDDKPISLGSHGYLISF